MNHVSFLHLAQLRGILKQGRQIKQSLLVVTVVSINCILEVYCFLLQQSSYFACASIHPSCLLWLIGHLYLSCHRLCKWPAFILCFSRLLDHLKHLKSAFSHSHALSYNVGSYYLAGCHLLIRATGSHSHVCARAHAHTHFGLWCTKKCDTSPHHRNESNKLVMMVYLYMWSDKQWKVELPFPMEMDWYSCIINTCQCPAFSISCFSLVKPRYYPLKALQRSPDSSSTVMLIPSSSALGSLVCWNLVQPSRRWEEHVQ